MTRFWNEFAGLFIDVVGIGWFVLIVLGVAALVGLGWHFFPRWLPDFRSFRFGERKRTARTRGRWRFRLPRWRRRPVRERLIPVSVEPVADDVLPDVPADLLRARADAYASAGRFAEAVRERLRAIVRELVDAGVVAAHPEWTITELARAAAAVEVALDPALSAAGTVFSDIWYGQRPGVAESDARMRAHDTEIHRIVAGRSAGRSMVLR